MSTGTELAFEGPTRLAELVRARELKPRELVELSLRRIEELDPKLNAFRVVLGERALADAEELEGIDGPLAGVPVAIKDDLAVASTGMVNAANQSESTPPQTRSSHAPRHGCGCCTRRGASRLC